MFKSASVTTATEASSNNAAADANNDAVLTVQGYDIKGNKDVQVQPQVRWHATAFYEKLIPIFENASTQFFLIKHAKYLQIVCTLRQVVDGSKTLLSCRGVYPQIHHWNKMYAISQGCPDSDILFACPKTGNYNEASVAIDMQDLR